jgi:hypothetical protein
MLSSEIGLDFDTFAMSSRCTRGGRSGIASLGIQEAFDGEELLSVDAARLPKRRMSVSWSWSGVGASEDEGEDGLGGGGGRHEGEDGLGGGGGRRGDVGEGGGESVGGGVGLRRRRMRTHGHINAGGVGEEVFWLSNDDDGGWLFSVAGE